EVTNLRQALGGGPRLLVKRDDAIPFGFGGNKVRKLELVAAEAVAAGADTLVTVGSVQSNHARVTAAVAAKLGLGCLIIINGEKPDRRSGNSLLADLLGAEIEYVATREERPAAIRAAVERLRRIGRTPYAVPLGASTPLGALGLVRSIGELLGQLPAPDAIVHATSSGGTQAGLVAGCALYGLETRVLGVSSDESAAEVERAVRGIVVGAGDLLGCDGEALAACALEVDDGFIGEGYGHPTAGSREAQRLAARSEALFVDHTYTAKALAALIAYVRAGRFRDDQTVLFWHTGGQVGLFA
ncbi:MAG: 1-aminocyclopropane-1-carboxylate deaminase/D-cysteine desulfhydrase, partial [Longimicrobiaceae bacterium]